MKFAYADPPYIGQAVRHYSHDERCAEVDHANLIARLCDEWPDGWALSASSPSLHQIVPLLPSEARILSWVKPFAAFKKNVTLAYAWEPVILFRGRKRPSTRPTVRDWIAENITLRKGLSGAKPERFCFWLFNALGAETGDTLDDLFPGTGIVSECWARFQRGDGRDETGGYRSTNKRVPIDMDIFA